MRIFLTFLGWLAALSFVSAAVPAPAPAPAPAPMSKSGPVKRAPTPKPAASKLTQAAPVPPGIGGMQAGKIKIFQAKGAVTIVNTITGDSGKVKRGKTIYEGTTLNTGPRARVLMLFNNGATINVSEKSSVSIVRFQQTPFDKKLGQYLRLKKDPSPSDTLVSLHYGEMVGKVKPLHPESLYDVETPVGSAGVRGTTFLVSFFVDENDNYVMKVGNLEGQVQLTTKMPANVSVSDQNVAEASFDPTATLSAGDVPEKSIVLVTAKPGDVLTDVTPEKLDRDTEYSEPEIAAELEEIVGLIEDALANQTGDGELNLEDLAEDLAGTETIDDVEIIERPERDPDVTSLNGEEGETTTGP